MFTYFIQVREERFIEDLETYNKLVEEFQTYSDVEELPKYLKKALHLDSKLIAAMEKIDRFNEEEQAFGWELSQYPMRKKVLINFQIHIFHRMLSGKFTYLVYFR